MRRSSKGPQAAAEMEPGTEAAAPASMSAGIFAIFARESQGHAATLLAALDAAQEQDALLPLAHSELECWRRDADLLRLAGLVSALLALEQRLESWKGRFTLAQQGVLLRGWVKRLRDLSDELACQKPSPRALRTVAELAAEIDGTASETGPAAPSAVPEASGRRILVLEDSPVIGEVLQEELRARGHAVALAHSVTAFEERMCAFVPDVLLIDVNMPELQGDMLCRRVRNSYPPGSIIVLLFSSIPPDDLARLAADAGADGFVSKHQPVAEMVRDVEARLTEPVPGSG